jgi:6-phosphogluconolactonase
LNLPTTVQQNLFASAAESAQALASTVAKALQEGLRHRGKASLIVSGGRTPSLFLNVLSSHMIDWANVDVSLADDRWLPADHADSNEHLVRQHLLRGPAAAARFVSLVNSAVTPEQHLLAAEQSLLQMSHPYDAVVLGVGDDGHTASLFPDADDITAALNLQKAQHLAVITPKAAPYQRITLTLRALLDARSLMILIEGSSKRTALENAAHGDSSKFAINTLLQQKSLPVHLFYNP